MSTIITYPSALSFWLFEKGVPYHYHFRRETAKVSNAKVLKTQFSMREITESVEKLQFQKPVHVAVPGGKKRISTDNIICHKLPDSLPQNSFLKISENIFIISPELCFLLAAADLELEKLVLLACELCAIYIPDEVEEYKQRSRDPVTSTTLINSFLKKAGGLKHIKKSKSAAKYAANCSNSPMESKLAVIAGLPINMGGYGLGSFRLNQEVPISKESEEYLGSQKCICDMVWSNYKVILEYDSTMTHLEIAQHYRDKKRTTALTMSGYKVISITAEQIRNFNAVDMTLRKVRRVLGLRSYHDRFEQHFVKRWDVVHSIMFKKFDWF